MKNEKKGSKKVYLEVLGAVLLLVVFVGPMFAFAGNRGDIFVDINAKGAQDGSIGHPYRAISDALSHSDKRTDVHIAKGEYKENVEIPKGVRVFGESKDAVVITAGRDSGSVVTMSDDSRINKVTIRKGGVGIKVREDSKVSIIECAIVDNDGDGIKIESGSTGKNDAISITDSVIRNNGRAGIFSKKHRLVIINNEISENDSDGIDISKGSSAWIEDNTVKNNGGSGMKVVMDESDIWTKSNTYRGNDHSGVEIDSFGKSGRVDFNKSKFVNNKNFGIVRVSHDFSAANIWNGLTSQKNNSFEQTKKGAISNIVRVK